MMELHEDWCFTAGSGLRVAAYLFMYLMKFILKFIFLFYLPE